MKTSLKKNLFAVGLACAITQPLTGQAATWDTVTTGDYQIRDRTNFTVPFKIADDAPSNTLFMANSGNVGLGTTVPGGTFSARLHIADLTPDILLEDTDNDQLWYLFADFEGMGFTDETGGTIPFFIESEAPFDSIRVAASGNVGLGTETPEEALHVVSTVNDFVRPLMVENTTAIRFSGFRLKIASDSWIDFNNAGGIFRVNADQNPGSEFEVQANGNSKVRGTMTAKNFVSSSDRNLKQDIAAVYHAEILDKVMRLPISEWSYKDSPDARHIGPMAQDFYRLFALGDTDKGITSIDSGGVALAAIQGVKKEKDQQIAELTASKDAEINALRADFEQLKSEQDERIVQLEMALMEIMQKQAGEMQVGSAD